MFKWFKNKDEKYIPKVNDVVYIPGRPERYLVVWVSRAEPNVQVMDEAGNVKIVETRILEKSQTTIGFLSGAQQDKYCNRSPEEMIERKINERLKSLVNPTELEFYKKVAAIRDLIIKDLIS